MKLNQWNWSAGLSLHHWLQGNKHQLCLSQKQEISSKCTLWIKFTPIMQELNKCVYMFQFEFKTNLSDYILAMLGVFFVWCRRDREIRCVKRKLLLEALANELPSGTIRYLSKVVALEESGFYKILHLADGTTIKTKVSNMSDMTYIIGIKK